MPESGALKRVGFRCSANGGAFAIEFLRASSGAWEAQTAAQIDEALLTHHGETAQSLHGPARAGDSYPGCPYCGDKGFFVCDSCGQLHCLGKSREGDLGKIWATCFQCGIRLIKNPIRKMDLLD